MDTDTNYKTSQANQDNDNNEVSSTEDNHFEVEPAGLCRSTRHKKSPERFNPGMGEAASKWSDKAVFNNEKTAAMAAMIDTYVPIDNPDLKEIVALLADLDLEHCFEYPTATYLSEAYAHLAKKNKDPDTPSYWDAVTGEEADFWYDAMDEEIDNLVKRRTWDIIRRSDIGVKYKLGQIVPTTWAFKKKRYPDFTFRTFKARFCVRGDKQKQAVSKTEDGEELNT